MSWGETIALVAIFTLPFSALALLWQILRAATIRSASAGRPSRRALYLFGAGAGWLAAPAALSVGETVFARPTLGERESFLLLGLALAAALALLPELLARLAPRRRP